MKHNMQQFLMKYIAEGITAGLSEEDKGLTLYSMNLSNNMSNAIFDEMTGAGGVLKEMEIEEAELLNYTGVMIEAILKSLTPSVIKKASTLAAARNKSVIGPAAAKKLQDHDLKVARKLVSNLKKMQSNTKFRIAVAQKCHLKIV